jgi:succinoglycan biosynthesis protein ExoM
MSAQDDPHGPDDGTLTLAVLTYRRPEDVTELLPQLVEQGATVDTDVQVLVVDNDADASARSRVEELGLPGVRYVVEPQPGIAAARNRVLQEAKGSHRLVFIDDDERPEPGWLSALLECHRRHGSAAVAGAVVPELGHIDDDWISAGGFFVRQRHTTGTSLEAASTANLLLDLRQLERLGGFAFEESFSLTGGSDTLFTRQITGAGGRIVWCDEAVVVDHIRTQRISRRWVLQRHFRAGNSWARTTVALQHGRGRRALSRLGLTGAGAARVGVGLVRSGAGTVTRSRRDQARGARTAARGVGMLLGAWGGTYVEYRRPRLSPGS